MSNNSSEEMAQRILDVMLAQEVHVRNDDGTRHPATFALEKLSAPHQGVHAPEGCAFVVRDPNDGSTYVVTVTRLP